MYGITETTVHVTEKTLAAAGVEQATSVIGEPLKDLSLQVLDRYGEPVPTGVAGEIYVGGAGVTRGYLGRAALTAQRFVPDPYGPPGARLYRSGDVARRLPDGGLVYLGRADQQIKLRGFRIEPGEVEATLRAQEGVQDAVVMLDTPAQGKPRLVAYVTGVVEPLALRENLSRQLPGHMVPALIMPLERFSLTAHGKLDCKALPRPGVVATSGQVPRTDVEKMLARIWAEALHIPEPGIDDNFFSLGGDSISALQVVAKARAAGIAINLEEFFSATGIRKIADNVKESAASSSAQMIPPFALLSESDRANLPTGLDDALPLSRLQGGMLFHSNLEDESSIFHDVFSFRLRIPWSEQEWRNAIERLPSYHAALRTSFHWTGYSEPLQLIHTFAEADYQIVDLRGLQADQRDQLIDDFLAKARRHPLDPSSGRMLRITLHRHADEELQLTLDFHHAIMDGWSVATLLTDLVRMATDVDWLPIPANASLTATFVSAEREAEADQALLNVWRERLANVAPTLLATHVSNERVGVRQIVRRAFRLPDSLAEGIEHRAKELGVSLKTVLLTAHLRALARTSGQAVVNTGYVTHGRPVEATAIAAVGLFLNTLPFSLALHPSSWTELVCAVAAEERAILAIRRLPAVAIKALGGGVQFYDVGFNYIHFHVYAGLRGLKRFEFLGLDIFEETDFPLLAQYAKDPLDGSLEMTLIRDSAIITEWQVEQFADLVLQALEALVSKPDASWHINALPKGAAPAAGSCMESAGVTSDLCTHFESSVLRHGAIPAVSYERQILSYVELDEAANRLAWRLRELGVGVGEQESLVGLSAE
ncbi:condensation domain-containing protein, partial [Candidatus Fukatsuia symbiotica]